MYKYILWDIDGTVLDFEAAESQAIKFLFKKYNLGICTDEMIADYSKINVRYWQALERGEMTKPEILVGRFKEFFEYIGVDASVAEAFNSDYQIALGDYVVFEDGAMDVLNDERNAANADGTRKYRIIAVTNGTKVAQTKKLKTSGLVTIFDAVYISEDVGVEKPNKEYFDILFEKEGITNLNEVVIIGDSLTSDILGGNNAGIDTIWYNKSKKVNDKGVSVTHEVQNLREVADLV